MIQEKEGNIAALVVLGEAGGNVMEPINRGVGLIQDHEQFTHSNSSSRESRVCGHS